MRTRREIHSQPIFVKFIRLCSFNSNTYPLCEKFILDCALTSNEVFWVYSCPAIIIVTRCCFTYVTSCEKRKVTKTIDFTLPNFKCNYVLFDVFISKANILYFGQSFINDICSFSSLFSYQNLFQFVYFFFFLKYKEDFVNIFVSSFSF